MLKKYFLYLVLGVFFSLVITTVSYSTEVSLDNGGVIFTPPKGFQKMPDDLLRLKYPSERRPRIVYGNKDYSVTVGVKFTENLLSIDELGALQQMYEETLPRMVPNLEWVSKRILEINGNQWLVMEFRSSAIDTDIHNIMCSTSYKGKMLLFNFNSTVKRFKKYQNKLLNSIFSIHIDEGKLGGVTQ